MKKIIILAIAALFFISMPVLAGQVKYVVKKGDSLWSIAKKQLGDGSRYQEIKKLNNLGSKGIYVGQELILAEEKKSSQSDIRVKPANPGWKKFNFMVEVVGQESVERGQNKESVYSWAKLQWRPFGSGKTNIGIFLSGAVNNGFYNNYHSVSSQAGGGISFKTGRKKCWSTSLDLGLAELSSNGKQGLYENQQDGYAYLASAYAEIPYRRDHGHKSFPGISFNFYLKAPFNESAEQTWDGGNLGSKIYDNGYWEMRASPDIYDFRFGKYRFTPGLKISYGHEAGPQKHFLKAGLYFTSHFFNYTICPTIGYKERLDSENDSQYISIFFQKEF